MDRYLEQIWGFLWLLNRTLNRMVCFFGWHDYRFINTTANSHGMKATLNKYKCVDCPVGYVQIRETGKKVRVAEYTDATIIG